MNKRIGLILALVMVMLGGWVGQSDAWYQPYGHGYRPYGYGHRPYGYGYRYPGVVVVPRVVVPMEPWWYPYPPVVVEPYPRVVVERPPQVVLPPQPPPSWYYCENPQGYYPYVQQCPGGWRQVAPTPPPAPPGQ
jgi:hypothetical protein